jgi:Domain of Unknown Function (DUF1080)/FHA domain
MRVRFVLSAGLLLNWTTGLHAAVPISHADVAAGWILLFDGESQFGWTSIGNATWNVVNGALTADGSDSASLRTNSPFADFDFHAEFRIHGSGGVYLRIPPSMKVEDSHRVQLGGTDKNGNRWSTLDAIASGDHITVRIDGQVVSESISKRSWMGFIGLYAAGGGKAEFQNVRLRPLGLQALYNGANLDGWKLADQSDKQDKKAPPKKILKMIPLPSAKDKPAKWTVEGAVVHGGKGMGQIETQNLFDDFVLQLEARDTSNHSAKEIAKGVDLVLRGQPGKFSSGYESPLGNGPHSPAGGIGEFQAARRVLTANGEYFIETVVALGRHLAVWVNGFPVTDFEDRRPAGQHLGTEADLGKGTIALAAKSDSASADFKSIRVAEYVAPKPAEAKNEPTSGLSAGAPSPAASVGGPRTSAGSVSSITTSAASPPTPAPGTPPPATPGSNPLLEQIAAQQAADREKQHTLGQLMQHGLSAKSPEEQVNIYNEILKIDPTNQVAFNARKEAQDKIDARNAEQAKMVQEGQRNVDREQETQRLLAEAERALVQNNLTQANAQITAAGRLTPGNPDVGRLSALVQSRLQVQNRIRYMIFGGCGVGGICALVAFIARIRRQNPYLVITEGLDKGKEYELKSRVTRIGAIPQDAGNRNDIVVTDVAHSVSRFHCEIHQLKGKLYLLDCDSANGTYVNSSRVANGRPVRLGRGTRIGLGKSCSLSLEYRRAPKG